MTLRSRDCKRTNIKVLLLTIQKLSLTIGEGYTFKFFKFSQTEQSRKWCLINSDGGRAMVLKQNMFDHQYAYTYENY